MSIIKVDYGEITENNPMVFSFNFGELVNVTDTNPLVIDGDFSNIKTMVVVGTYMAQKNNSNGNLECRQQAVTLGTKYKVRTAVTSTSSYVGYRNITINTNKIIIGSGYYDNTQDSNYGGLEILALSDMELWQR